MKNKKLHLYHGIALTQIVEHESFTALNRGSQKYGHYLINTDRHVFVKYSTAERESWSFTFSTEELTEIREAVHKHQKFFVCLVCGETTVCALTIDEICEVMNLKDQDRQSIKVTVPQGGSCHVVGALGKLKRAVPHNSYPKKLFE